MLCLSRRANQSIVIGDGVKYPKITVTVNEIRSDKVRLGFSASPDIPIHRQEIYDQIQREKSAPAGESEVV